MGRLAFTSTLLAAAFWQAGATRAQPDAAFSDTTKTVRLAGTPEEIGTLWGEIKDLADEGGSSLRSE